jgi:hypothetical protein
VEPENAADKDSVSVESVVEKVSRPEKVVQPEKEVRKENCSEN